MSGIILGRKVLSQRQKQQQRTEYINRTMYINRVRYVNYIKHKNRIHNISKSKKRVAIIFYGLSRTLSKTVESIKKNILDPLKNNNIDYDIFIHTYKINGSYHNRWSKESVEIYKNENIEELINPNYFIYDNQEDIVNTINFDEYYTKLSTWHEASENTDFIKYLIRNLCLALYSKKRIMEVFEKHKTAYDYCIISRPDLEFKNELNVKWFDELKNNNIIIPEHDWFHGVNDRFCIGTPEIILFYGKLFDYLKKYSSRKSICSEEYLRVMLYYAKINIIKKNIEYDTIRIVGN